MSVPLPELFRGGIEYYRNSSALELAQATFNEELLYAAIENYAAEWFGLRGRPPVVLDVCCASGLSAMRVARAVPVKSIELVDVDSAALDLASQRLRNVAPVLTHAIDALYFEPGRTFDLILANSAYHHTEGCRKVRFLQRLRQCLAPDGWIIVGEHFLPSYRSFHQFQLAVERFYRALLGELSRRGESPEAIGVIRRSGLYCWQGVYEYKVSWRVFARHVRAAGLAVRAWRQVWKPSELDGDMVGSIAVTLCVPAVGRGGAPCQVKSSQPWRR